MHTLRKRHSWPPLRMSRTSYLKESIDQDPFAYFVSPASDRDVYFNDTLSAGIDTRRRSKSHSPPSHSDHFVRFSAIRASSPTAKLKKWIERMELRCFHRSANTVERPGSSPDLLRPLETPSPISSIIGGKEGARSSSSLCLSPNGRSRPRRPRSWREPSQGIWPVAEEAEEIGLGIVV